MKTDNNKADWIYGEPTTGAIARIVKDRGFGFIRAGENDYFMHMSDYEGDFGTLRETMVMNFIPTQTKKGLRATGVRKVQ